MEEETMLALNQDAHLFLRSTHVREINKVVKNKRKQFVWDLSWEYGFVKRDLQEAEAAMKNRFNIFKWLDRKDLERAQARYDDVVNKVHAAGLRIEGEE